MLRRHLFRLLTLLALLIAPLPMLAAAPAIAAPQAAPAGAEAGHCAEMDGMHERSADKQQPSKSADCLLDCMVLCSGLPSLWPQLAAPLPPASMAPAPLTSPLERGLSPQAEPRPPRMS